MDPFNIDGNGDYHVGPYQLSKHFRIPLQQPGGTPTDNVSVLDSTGPAELRAAAARVLSLLEAPPLASGRAPLFTCYCGDLACGAVTVAVSDHGDSIRWSDFGMETGDDSGYTQSEFMKRTRALEFEKSAYLRALSGFFE